jgi:exonuclease-1
VPKDYEERFQRTLWVFQHQRVYCTRARAMVHVRPLPPGGIGAAGVHVTSAVPREADEHGLDFLGPMLDDALAQGIAEGGSRRARERVEGGGKGE